MRKPALSKTNRVKRVTLPSRAIAHPMELTIEGLTELSDGAWELELTEPPVSDFPNDRYEIVRTPQEWHQEHLEYVERTQLKYNSSLQEVEELEAVAYFDHAHIRLVFCCTHCLEMMPWLGKMFDRTHVCPKCGESMTGEQACRAAYLALLGRMHPQCTLTKKEFHNKTHNLDPNEFVQQYMDCVDKHKHKCNIAERRALKLMKDLFGERVYNQIVNNGETWVKGADGMHYRIFWSRHGNVAVYEHRYKTHATKEGKPWKPVAAYCGHFGEDYPISDQIIAQICMLRTDPQRYINQANKVKSEHFSSCGPEFLHKSMMEKIMAIEV